MNVPSIQGGNQVISHPKGMLMLDGVKDVVSTLLFPSFEILIRHIAVHVGEAAGSALFAFDLCNRFHSSLLRPIFPGQGITMKNRIPKTR